MLFCQLQHVAFDCSVHETSSDHLTCQTKIILVRHLLLLHRTGGPVKILGLNCAKNGSVRLNI